MRATAMADAPESPLTVLAGNVAAEARSRLSPKRFHVLTTVAYSPPSPHQVGLSLRCTVCGVRSGLFGMDGDAVLLSELDEWAAEHKCLGLTVN